MDNKIIERKIDEIISQLTIEEKAAMCRATSKFFSNGVERLGINRRIIRQYFLSWRNC